MAGCVGVCGEKREKANVASVEVEVVVVVEAKTKKRFITMTIWYVA